MAIMTRDLELSVENLVDRLTASFKGELEQLVLAKLHEQVDPILKDAAHRMAHNLHGIIQARRVMETGAVNVVLRIDGVETAIKEEQRRGN